MWMPVQVSQGRISADDLQQTRLRQEPPTSRIEKEEEMMEHKELMEAQDERLKKGEELSNLLKRSIEECKVLNKRLQDIINRR